MRAVLLDTHAWAWSLIDSGRLSGKAVAEITSADRILLSPVSFLEIAHKVRIGQWPEMDPHVLRRPMLPDEQGGVIAGLDPEICITAGTMVWAHRDPFDRLLAATAQHRRVPIVSADTVFDGIVDRLW